MTSNGVECTRDLANRSSIIRIRKRVGFAYRTYDEGDLLNHVHANQAYYLGCVFSVIREWIECGKQRSSVTEHDFREWAQTADWIVQHIFHAAPLLEGHLQAQQRVSDSALSFVRSVALEVRTAGKLGDTLFAHDIDDLCMEAGIKIPGLQSHCDGAGSRMIGTLMKRAFADSDSLAVDEFAVTRIITQQPRVGGGTRNVNAYRISQ